MFEIGFAPETMAHLAVIERRYHRLIENGVGVKVRERLLVGGEEFEL